MSQFSENSPGNLLLSSAKIKSLVDDLVREAQRELAQLNKIDPGQAEAKASYLELIEDAGKVRGRPLFFPYIGSGRGHGCYVELADGSVKMDLINGIGIHLFGHSHPELIRAGIEGALMDVINQGNIQPNQEYHQILKKLVQMAGKKSRLKYAWLSTCGTMANENALKMARQKKSPARLIVAMQNAFAGRSTLMAEVTDNPDFKQGLPTYEDVLRIPFYNKQNPRSTEDSLRQLKEHYARHGKNIAAFTFEPMQGEGGYHAAPREFFMPLLEFCRAEKIAVWVDEVQTFCRTGELFAFERLDFGEYVDLCTVAKTLQVGATLYTEEYNPKPGLIAGTFSGSTVALRAGLKTLNMLSEGQYFGAKGSIQKIHDEFVGGLNRLNETVCRGLLNDAGGLGLMVAVTPFDGGKDKTMLLMKTLFQNGLVAYYCGHGPYRIRFLLPIVMTSEDVKTALKIIEQSVLEIA